MAEDQQDQMGENDVILRTNTSFEAIDNLNKFMSQANMRYGTISDVISPRNRNRSFDIYGRTTPEINKTECVSTPISASKSKGMQLDQS